MKILKPIILSVLCGILSLSTLMANPEMSPVARKYIDQYKSIAISEMHRTGIPASIKLAQGLLESNWGRSDLARHANNHFGIKCGGKWEGKTFYKEDDDKDEFGNIASSCFRVFGSGFDSYIAHSEFLTSEDNRNRYGFLFEHGKNYKAWAAGLKKAGYASDPKYPKKLIEIIKKYKLYQYDKIDEFEEPPLAQATPSKKKEEIKSKVRSSSDSVYADSSNDMVAAGDKERKPSRLKSSDSKPKRARIKSHGKASYKSKRVKAKKVALQESGSKEKRVSRYPLRSKNAVKMVKAKGGETPESLAHSVGIDFDKLMEYNDDFGGQYTTLPKGMNIFLEKKNKSYHGNGGYHKSKPDETMFDISQKYGVRLSSLYSKNRMKEGEQPVEGSKISLIKKIDKVIIPEFPEEGTPRNAEVYLF